MFRRGGFDIESLSRLIALVGSNVYLHRGTPQLNAHSVLIARHDDQIPENKVGSEDKELAHIGVHGRKTKTRAILHAEFGFRIVLYYCVRQSEILFFERAFS